MSPVSLPDEVRAACAWVAERARWVRIDETRIERCAAGLDPAAEDDPALERHGRREPESAAALAICMNAINFGSGWWPTVRKRPGLSGYGTMEAGITEPVRRGLARPVDPSHDEQRLTVKEAFNCDGTACEAPGGHHRVSRQCVEPGSPAGQPLPLRGKRGRGGHRH